MRHPTSSFNHVKMILTERCFTSKNSNGPLSVAKCGYECGCQCQVETGPGTDFLKATATQRSGTLILSGGLTQTGLHGARAPPLKAFYSGTNQYRTPLGSLGNCGPMNEAESAYSVHPGQHPWQQREKFGMATLLGIFFTCMCAVRRQGV